MQQRFLLVAFFLVIALGATIAATNSTINAIQTVHQQQLLADRGDVRLIHQWMTIPYVAHVYRIPEKILYTALKLDNSPVNRHSTLQMIALQKKMSTETVIHKIQATILIYRQSHPFKPYPTPALMRGEMRSI